MMFKSLFAIFAAASAANAAAIDLTPRASCKTYAWGYLSANVTSIHTLKAFTTGPSNKLIYKGDGKKPLKAAFQVCSPPYQEDEPGSGEYAGRLYVSTENKCVHISNQSKTSPPYYPVVVPCTGGPAEAFVLRTHEKNAIYWAGMTDVEGTTPQGGCGLFGYASHDKGTPTTVADKQIELQCYGHSTPFYFSDTAH